MDSSRKRCFFRINAFLNLRFLLRKGKVLMEESGPSLSPLKKMPHLASAKLLIRTESKTWKTKGRSISIIIESSTKITIKFKLRQMGIIEKEYHYLITPKKI